MDNDTKYLELLMFINELQYDEKEGHLDNLTIKEVLDHIVYEADAIDAKDQ